ncbi:hypothetical protein MSS4_01894 [Mycobacterium marinum]|nr:hypothetical protein MSS4_01894 [Mycobacterium marinum]
MWCQSCRRIVAGILVDSMILIRIDWGVYTPAVAVFSVG